MQNTGWNFTHLKKKTMQGKHTHTKRYKRLFISTAEEKEQDHNNIRKQQNVLLQVRHEIHSGDSSDLHGSHVNVESQTSICSTAFILLPIFCRILLLQPKLPKNTQHSLIMPHCITKNTQFHLKRIEQALLKPQTVTFFVFAKI